MISVTDVLSVTDVISVTGVIYVTDVISVIDGISVNRCDPCHSCRLITHVNLVTVVITVIFTGTLA